MAKKRSSIAISEETKGKILKWGKENGVDGGLSSAIEKMAATLDEPAPENRENEENTEPEQEERTELEERAIQSCEEIDRKFFAIGCAVVAGVCFSVVKMLFRSK